MDRHRWFSVGLSIPFNQLLKKLKKFEFKEGQDFGFISRESDKLDRFRFRYLRRTIVKLPILGASGDMEYQGIETIVDLNFEFFEKNEHVWLKIDEPPRSIRDFLNALEDVAGFGFFAEPVLFSLKKQKTALKTFDSVRLIGFRGLGNSIQDKFIARVDVASKDGLEPDRLDLLSGLDFRMDQTTYEVSYRMLKGQITFAASGLVRTTGAISPYIIESLERTL